MCGANRWCELSAAAATCATPLEVATSFALLRCSRDNRKYTVQHGEGILRKPFRQDHFKLCIKRRDALRRQARTHSRTGANAPAPCLVRIGHIQVERKSLQATKSRRCQTTEPLGIHSHPAAQFPL